MRIIALNSASAPQFPPTPYPQTSKLDRGAGRSYGKTQHIAWNDRFAERALSMPMKKTLGVVFNAMECTINIPPPRHRLDDQNAGHDAIQ